VAGIIEVDSQEIDWLARLCWIEVRGFGDHSAGACASVVSTVIERIRRGVDSDGTIGGTITWGCGPGVLTCAFPAYAVNGCAGIEPGACPLDGDPLLIEFRADVLNFLTGGLTPDCGYYLYYSSRSTETTECLIEPPHGSAERFHN
jgi:hypothetical protein